jgi:hypothetical protein
VDHLAHGAIEATWRVDGHDQQRGVVSLGNFHDPVEVPGRYRIDFAVQRSDDKQEPPSRPQLTWSSAAVRREARWHQPAASLSAVGSPPRTKRVTWSARRHDFRSSRGRCRRYVGSGLLAFGILVARLVGSPAAYQFTALPCQVAAWTGSIQQAVSVGI